MQAVTISLLLLTSAKICLLEVRPYCHGQPVSLKQLPGGKSSSFETQMNQPVGCLL
jgi:hypothetical protein